MGLVGHREFIGLQQSRANRGHECRPVGSPGSEPAVRTADISGTSVVCLGSPSSGSVDPRSDALSRCFLLWLKLVPAAQQVVDLICSCHVCSDLTCSPAVRSVSVMMWRSSLPAVGRRRTGEAHGRSWLGIAAGSCGAVRRWSRALGSVCSHSTAARCSRDSLPSVTPDRSHRWMNAELVLSRFQTVSVLRSDLQLWGENKPKTNRCFHQITTEPIRGCF
ncbi:hypothetical protein CHARACLAT_010946 [Characodon lateralis]|uniref:Uncharacterized protein n=1 Tax=Characodon lateralis TaxID=208331 RepID=A0ABU7ESP2_9TELE|nr:hypothetical protein [Characodon lateralis]